MQPVRDWRAAHKIHLDVLAATQRCGIETLLGARRGPRKFGKANRQ